MSENYYCNQHWFKTYDEAKMYANKVLEMSNKYYVIMTKAEVDSITNAIDKAIDHEMECGK